MTDHETRSSDELEPAQSRRSPWGWAALTAVAAVVAVVAGLVGYAVGTGSDDGAAPAAAPIALATGVPSAADAAGEARPGVDGMPWYGFGRIVFESRGLSDETGSATAYAYDPRQVFSRQTAAAAADVLGVTGGPTLDSGIWVVGPVDGSGRSLQLMPDGWATLSYYDPSLEPYGCAVAEPGGAGVGGGSVGEDRTDAPGTQTDEAPPGDSDTDSGSPGEPAPDDPGAVCRTPRQDAERDAAAVERTRTLLADLGVDVDGVELEAGSYGGSGSAFVTAYDVVGGQRTGATWSAVWVGREVQSFYGPLAPLVSLGSYDVVGARTATERLGDPRFGVGTSGGVYPLVLGAEDGLPQAIDAGSGSSGDAVAADGVTATATLPPPVEPGSRFAWPVQQVTITQARLGLALYWQPDGSQVLLPTYELTDDEGGVWAVVAVSDDGLDFATR